MKIKYKIAIILAVFMLFSVVSCLNNVMAVGRIAYGWITLDRSGERVMLYRVYTTPADAAVTYYNDNKNSQNAEEFMYSHFITAKTIKASWIYDYQFIKPVTDTFNTINLAFHKEPLCEYEERRR